MAAAAELKRGSVARAPSNGAVGVNGYDVSGTMNAHTMNGGAQLPALPTDVLIENIRRLSARIEDAEKRTAESVLPLAEKMAGLSERIEEVSARANATTKPMERALARMAERLEKLESGGASGGPGVAGAGEPQKTSRRRFFGSA
jgi:hypothetical protein